MLASHRGRTPAFSAVSIDASQSLILKLPEDFAIRPSQTLVDDLEQALGSGAVQLYGIGSRCVKRQATQQAPFKAEGAAEGEVAVQTTEAEGELEASLAGEQD